MRYRKISSGEIVEFPEPVVAFDVSTAWERVEAIEAKQQESGDGSVDLSKLKRGELNELAASLGVEDAEKLPNAPAVIEAIEAKQQESGD